MLNVYMMNYVLIPNFLIYKEVQPISEFINLELIEYSIANVIRSIPKFGDGLKPVQRKVIWGSFKHWKKQVGKPSAKSKKITSLAANISDRTNYHHGPNSITDTINNMVVRYVGTNNIPYFFPDGRFANRNGDKAASARYPFTYPEWWWPLVYRPEDEPLLTLTIDEGEQCEPEVMLPIIPMALINGCKGIGTGWSTFIPDHNPLDICNWIQSKIEGKPLPNLKPWYRGFTGTIEFKLKTSKKKVKPPSSDGLAAIKARLNGVAGPSEEPEDVLGDDEEMMIHDGRTRLSLVVKGVYHEDNKGRVIVTELPIDRPISKYNEWLQQQLTDKIIRGFDNLSAGDKPKFIIRGMERPDLKKLRLIKTYGMSNMVLLNNKYKPVRFDSVVDIMETFYNWRLPFYQKRKQNIILEYDARLKHLNDKIRFITAVLKGNELRQEIHGETIIIFKRTKAQIYPQMKALQLPTDLLKKTNLANCTEDEIAKSITEIEKISAARQRIVDTKSEQLWLNDLNEFLAAYHKHYKPSKGKGPR